MVFLYTTLALLALYLIFWKRLKILFTIAYGLSMILIMYAGFKIHLIVGIIACIICFFAIPYLFVEEKK